MINKPMDVMAQFPVRKTKKQKQAFRDEIQSYVKTLGYESTVEKGSLGSKNLLIGDPEKAEYLMTAHYDTCARLPFPNLITPCNFWAFLGYQTFMMLVFFAIAAVFGLVAMLFTRDGDTIFLVSYFALLASLVLMMVGPANKTNANDNTSGVVSVLEIAKDLPEEFREKVCFVLFDLEEAGLIGSASYQNKHKKQTKNQIVLNLDCVGDGNEILMFPTSKLKKDAKKMEKLRSAVAVSGEKSLTLHEKGFSVYPSDQKNFPYGVGIAAFSRHKTVGLYCSRIHTPKDTILEEENVNLLRDRLICLITGSAAE